MGITCLQWLVVDYVDNFEDNILIVLINCSLVVTARTSINRCKLSLAVFNGGLCVFESFVLFVVVVVLHHSNIISVTWRRYDLGDEKEKAWAYTFTDLMDL